jgi:hypothetical protein
MSGSLGPVSRDSTGQEGRCRNSLRLPRPDDSARGLQMPYTVRQEAVEALPLAKTVISNKIWSMMVSIRKSTNIPMMN